MDIRRHDVRLEIKYGGFDDVFSTLYRVILYRSPDLGHRTGSATAQMLQRWMPRVALQPFSRADVCSQRGLKPGRLVVG